jgi:uracil-DNA glycosylase family 4
MDTKRPRSTLEQARPTQPRPIKAGREKADAWLRYFDDLGIRSFYIDRAAASVPSPEHDGIANEASAAVSGQRSPSPLPAAMNSTTLPERMPIETSVPSASSAASPDNPPDRNRSAEVGDVVHPSPLLQASPSTIVTESLEVISSDIGECTRCKLHRKRNKIVFGVGNARADLVFIGEGPGHDEDMQGLPFVGRAGKLLTQMIEAMGLRREDVYIANVVKCRPPENRQPEQDEVATCMPFLLRQLDAIQPKAIVCLGSTAAQALLETKKSISHFRGQWFDFRGAKLIPTYHPAYLLRNPNAKPDVWNDLKKVMTLLGLKQPRRDTSRA